MQDALAAERCKVARGVDQFWGVSDRVQKQGLYLGKIGELPQNCLVAGYLMGWGMQSCNNVGLMVDDALAAERLLC